MSLEKEVGEGLVVGQFIPQLHSKNA